jgi:hypothetical protein
MWNRLRRVWCEFSHRRISWPINGRYVCHQCGREFPVLWEGAVFESSRLEQPEPEIRLREPMLDPVASRQ